MGSKIMAVLLAGAGLVGLAPTASAQVQPTGAWAPETSGSQFRFGAAASDGAYLYTFGGPSNINSYRSMRRYDPVANAWADMAILPTQVQWNAGAYHNGRVYSFGNNWNGTGAIYQYTIATNSWTTLAATLSNNRSQASATVLGDLIYIAGGSYGPVSNQLDEFNPATGTITPRATMPGSVYRNSLAAVPALNKVYSFCGINANGQQQAVCYEYSVADNVWAARTPMTFNNVVQIRQAPFAFTLNDRIYVTGGHNGQQYWNMTMEYNPVNDTWTRRADMGWTRTFHSGGVIANKGYIHGGEPSYTPCEEYTPPVFGSAPDAPPDAAQAGSQADSAQQALGDPALRDGWTNNQITFSATVNDPDANQQVRLRVRVKPANAPNWNNATVLDSGLGGQGSRTVAWNIPATGDYDWQYRVEDAYSNSYPPGAAWADAFDNLNSPDFRSDQEVPTVPDPVSPDRLDVAVSDAAGGNIELKWIKSTDNGPASGINYEIQVATDGGFNGIEAQLFSPAATDATNVSLAVSRYDKFWRVRAHDVGGNLSEWSPPMVFRVTWNDGINHGSGDAKRGCGLAAASATSWLPGIVAALALLAGGMRKVRGR